MSRLLTISLRECINGNTTSDELLKGYHTRIIVDPEVENGTVASYARKHVLKKPDWLYKICAKVGGNGQKKQNQNEEFNVLVSFGDGKNINVQIRNKNSNSSKKKQTPVVSLHLGLFLRDGDDTAMLNPLENLNKIMLGSTLNCTPQLLICQSHPWSDKRLKNEIEASDTSLILIAKNNELYEVLTSDEEPSLEEQIQKKKRKKRIDPNAPKKLNSYQVFMAERRTKNPDASFVEVSKISAQEWKELSVKEKEPYEKLAEEDKARFEEKMATYVNPYASDNEPSSPKKRRKKDPNAPKAPLTIYLRYCNKMRAEVKEQNPDVPQKELFSILASKYKEISTDEKEKLEKAYAEDRLQYQKELKAYQELKNGNRDENSEGMKEEDTKTASPSKKRTTSKKSVKNQDDEQKDTFKKTNDNDEEDSPEKATKRSPSKRTSTKGKSKENEVETSSKKKGTESKRSRTLKRKSTKKDESPVKTRSKKEPETPATKVKERKSTGRKKRRKSSAKEGK